MASLTNLVEIDLLRGRQPLPLSGAAPSDYRILVSRSDRRPSAQLYGFSIRQAIPPFAVPLTPEDEEPSLDLQILLQHVYDRGRYHLAIDYTKPPQPPLSPEDTEWANELLQIQ